MHTLFSRPLTMDTDLRRRNATDRRSRTEQERKQNPEKPSVLPAAFAKEEVEAEDRRPKRKVAVMVGYSGTGYKGLQM